jgi:hypothetical protein
VKLLLTRHVRAPTFTAGVLAIDGQDFCATIEDCDRRLEAGGQKIAGQTAIPRGTYRVVVTPSPRFKRDLPLLVDVPQFSGVRIHSGNTAADTEGCILVGMPGQDDSQIINSRATFNKLFGRIKAALAADESVTLEVK